MKPRHSKMKVVVLTKMVIMMKAEITSDGNIMIRCFHAQACKAELHSLGGSHAIQYRLNAGHQPEIQRLIAVASA